MFINSCKARIFKSLVFVFMITALVGGFFVFNANPAQAETYIGVLILSTPNTVWTKEGSPYIVRYLSIPNGATLIIEPGVVVKFTDIYGVVINGDLIVQGTPEQKVVFTSIYDREYESDTNPDPSRDPQPGDWLGIYVDYRGEAIFDNAIISYAGTPTYGADISGAVSSMGGIFTINNSTIKDNLIGIRITINSLSLRFDVHNSEIFNNIEAGIKNEKIPIVDATNNWWGHISGPYHPVVNPEGQGDTIITDPFNDKVLFDPWIGKDEWEQQIDPLILKYEPILYLHPDETYQPMNVEAYVKHCSLWDSHGAGDDELLKAEDPLNPVTLGDLNFEDIDSSGYYLQFVEDLITKWPNADKAKTEYEQMKNEVKYTRYVTNMTDRVEETGEEYIVLQYWYFYAFNDWREKGGFNNHEGDWEVVMIFINKEDNQPKYIAYSSHHNRGRVEEPLQLQYTSVRRSWNSPEVTKQDGRIVSFVGVGSHANYPNNGNDGVHPIPLFPDDRTSVGGFHLENSNWENVVVFEENNLPEWLTGYQGKWGVVAGVWGFNGCNHPYPSQYSRFTEPIKWAGVDKVGEMTSYEANMDTLNFVKQRAKLVFGQVVDVGTTVLVDLHDEIVTFGENFKEIIFFPHFWDIESNLENGSFNAEVSLGYDEEMLEFLGLNEDYLIVLYYNEGTDLWEKVSSVVDVENKVIKFFTDHFSRYAIGVEKWQDITQDLKVVEEEKHYDRENRVKTIEVKVKNNIKESISSDLRLMVQNISESGVEWLNYTGETTDGVLYLDIGQPYKECIFQGVEEDIPEEVSKSDRKKLLKDKPLEQKECEKLVKKYPVLEDKIEWVLGPKRFSEDIVLEFGLPAEKTKIKNFKFEVRVLNKIVEW